jgi:hypothetical protein
MEQRAEEQTPVAAVGESPLSQPLPQEGERSPNESLLGATPVPETPKETPAAEPAVAQRPGYGEFTLPEGVTVDAESLKPATELFAESGLSQEQAQKFIDLAMARETAAAQRGVQAFVDLQNQWVAEVKADPDIGGAKLTAALASAARAIDRLEVPGLREALSFTGAGNHPAVVRAFVRLGQMLSEDRFRPARPVAPLPPRSPAEVIYDGSPKGSADGL